MRSTLTQQGRLDFSVGYRLQTIWGWREAVVFFREGLGVALVAGFSLLDLIPGMIAGILLMVAAVLLLLSHLGHPIRAWMALRNVRRSWVSRGTLAIPVFTALAIVLVGIRLSAGGATHGLLDMSLRIALFLSGSFILLYPGFAMAGSPAIPFWNSGLLPVVSLVNGIASGGLALTVFLATHERVDQTGWPVNVLWFEQGTLCLLALITFVYMVTMLNAGAAARMSVTYLMTKQPMLFWILAVGAGLVIPIAAVSVALSANAAPLGLLWIALGARIVGDVSVRYALLKGGIFDAVLQSNDRT